jgi:hypothetical protein
VVTYQDTGDTDTSLVIFDLFGEIQAQYYLEGFDPTYTLLTDWFKE